MVPLATAVPRTGGTKSTPHSSAPPPLSRKSTLVRKHDETDMELETNSIPISPSKRAKVAFNDEVDVKVVDEWGKSPELVREEVRQALERRCRGDNADYEALKSIYSPDTRAGPGLSATTFKNYTIALTANAALLNHSYSGLVRAMLRSDWPMRDESTAALFSRFMGNLVSSQGTWLSEVLETLVRCFTNNSRPSSATADQAKASLAESRQHIHSALGYLLRLIPFASNSLLGILSLYFPNQSDSKRSHLRFVRNILKLAEYAPELRTEILSLVIDRVVKIDVQVQVDISTLADEIGEGLEEEIPELQAGWEEDDDEDDSDESDESDEESDDEDLAGDKSSQVARQQLAIKSNVEKLDAILDLLFRYYADLFKNPSTRDLAFDSLMSQFSNTILPTYRSRHTQFLIFHFVQISPELIDIFNGLLVRTVFDKSCPSIARQSAASYLASFVSRGVHVPANSVRDVFDYLGDQLAQLRAKHLPACRGPDLSRYQTYYALTQALLYMFCFRWRDLVANPSDSPHASPPNMASLPDEDDETQPPTFISGVKDILSTNIFSALNPLKVCAPAIVAEFARIAHRVRIVYVYHLVETNKRIRLPQPIASVGQRETALSSRKDDEWQRLDAYFPFDPYRLPRSKRWVEGDYRVWEGVPGEDDDGSDSEAESDEESEGEETGTDGD